MYRKRHKQITLYENPLSFADAKLSPDNRWIQMAQMIPWDSIEEKYFQTFENPIVGNPARSCRMALGSLIIKEKYQLSDVETVAMIAENPYLQFFIGLSEFRSKTPFDASTMTLFRKRLSAEALAEINRMVIDAQAKDDDDTSDGGSSAGEPSPDSRVDSDAGNKGTLILDATCAPADIHFPTDVSLLNEGREKLEEMVDTLHTADQGRKPRTYREGARKQYMRFVRNRKPRMQQIRKAIRQQLNYVRRDLEIVKEQMNQSDRVLSSKQLQYLETIQGLYQQQKHMFDHHTHRIDNRIVSIHQPWVRPIVRGKATASVEFGAKVSISMSDGYAMIERLEWDAYNEAGSLVETIEKFYERTGHYPNRILADKIYRNRTNLQYCDKHHIRFNGPKLGRPPKDKTIYAEQKRLERLESGERNAVEGKFGEGKRCYGLNRVMTRLKGTSEVAIHVTFLVMNLEKRLRDLIFSIYRWLFGCTPKPQLHKTGVAQ